MEQNILKLNILAIAGFGILVTILGLALYFFQDAVAEYVRFLLPIPPLAVAAYVFVINMFRQYAGKMPENNLELVKELLTGIGIAALIFGLLSLGLTFFLDYARRFF